MAEIETLNSSNSQLLNLLESTDIKPGSRAGYRLCKLLWAYHPLGGKLVEKPINMALCKPRSWNVKTDPDERVIKRFIEVWEKLNITQKIRDAYFTQRCYGASAIGVGTLNKKSDEYLDKKDLREDNIFINIFDPLNVAGSMVTSQDPNSPDFQQADLYLNVASEYWHPSRTVKIFNGSPIYLEYQNSAYGYTGRSVFLRSLYPLRSYLKTMEANEVIAEKTALIVAKTAQNSSVISGVMQKLGAIKRGFVKSGKNGNVLQIGKEDSIESLNMTNVDGPLSLSRDNIISDIASGSDIPAILLKEEAFTHGFGEGTEDSKAISQYIDGVRQEIDPVMKYFEELIQHIAWTEDFFDTLKNEYPDVFTDDYETTFYQWKDEFTASWQELVEESPNKRRESDAVVIQNAARIYAVLAPNLDPENKATLSDWLVSICNATETYKDNPCVLDVENLKNYQPTPEEVKESGQKEPFHW
ncbi:MAG TPA: anti-CBASS protein Acb1 family protein [Arsenophonus nasoniae]|uniref:anti-CBASS protein Acb1 family protein n=1 Tax=Arsenophonus nasoniae TaxID=638 RepID=UPI003879F046